MKSKWSGTVDLGSGWLRYEGPLIGAEMHAHHATQVIVASRPVTLSSPAGEPVTTNRAIVPPDVEHAIEASGQAGTLIYFEPPSTGRARPTDPATWATAAAGIPDLRLGAGVEAVDALREHAWSRSSHDGTDQRLDPQVLEAQAAIRALLPARVRLPDIAGQIGVSPSRLTHRFSAASGIPFGRWVLWERLQLAGAAVAHGADLTEAAHQSGFADSAHLNRTFRKMFGIAPSDVAGAVSWRVHP